MAKAVNRLAGLLESASSRLGFAPVAASSGSPISALRSLSSAGQPQPHPHQDSKATEETASSTSAASGTQDSQGEAKRAGEGKDADHNDDDGGVYVNKQTGEIGGPRGPEPTRYGDWERGGRCSDF